MRYFILLISVFLLRTPLQAAAPGPWGLGLMIGSTTSVTAKFWLAQQSKNQGALDFGLILQGFPGTGLYLNYLWHIPGAFGSGSKFGRETSLYFGGGGGLAFWNTNYNCGYWRCDRSRNTDTGLFIRGLVGFEWYATPTRFGVFAEASPTLLLSPATGTGLDLNVGGRWYF